MPDQGLTSSTHADRNLLFGILALQMDFISRDALVQAMSAWALAKEKPLGQLLEEHGALPAERRTLLDALVQEHLKQHDHDTRKSLAALHPPGQTLAELRQVSDADVQASLVQIATLPFVDNPRADTPHAGGPYAGDPYATTLPTRPADPVPTRFRILRPHARGGLGQVSVARDEELQRDVALKEIQEQHADNPESRRRFLREAEITGGLEHPGIVPVYGLGSSADGRPYYAMRFIRGDSLKDAIDRFHQTDDSKRHRAQRGLELRQLLRRFFDVCNAMEYAHSRGVLHRDLKPDNIMLGRYGETLIVDWGLAKALNKSDLPSTAPTLDAEARLFPASNRAGVETQMGSTLGTPAYMCPEQAEGRLDLLGPVSDVYSLGATLYCLLTGQPPFTDKTTLDVLKKVRRGDLRRPRALKPTVPVGLEAICLKAMALRPEDRYPTARALAADIENWLADEPIRAGHEPWLNRLGRWARKHKTVVAGVVGLLFSTVVALAVSTVLIGREHAQTEAARVQAQNNYEDAEQARQKAVQSAAEAQTQRRRAEQQATLAEQSAAEARNEWRRAETNYAAAEKERQRAEQNATEAGNQRPRAVANYEKAQQAVDVMLTKVGEERLAHVPQMEGVRRELLEEALKFYQAFRNENARDPSLRKETGHAFLRLGNLQAWLGDKEAAQNAYRAAQVIYDELIREFPSVYEYCSNRAACHHNLGLILRGDPTGDADAETEFRRALSDREQLVEEFPDDLKYANRLADSYNDLGILLWETKRPQEAEKAYRRALAVREPLAQRDPTAPLYQAGLALTHNNLAILLGAGARKKEAEAAFRRANAVYEQLAQDFPAVPTYQADLACNQNNLGLLLQQRQRTKEAEQAYRQAVAIRTHLVRDFPTVPTYQTDLTHTLQNLGSLLKDSGRQKEAQEALQRAHMVGKTTTDDTLSEAPITKESYNKQNAAQAGGTSPGQGSATLGQTSPSRPNVRFSGRTSGASPPNGPPR